MSADAINFKLDKNFNSEELIYRPFGVRTVKLCVSSESKDQPALRLRVKDKTEEDIMQNSFRGFPENNHSLMVSWGGGHEPGPCVKAKDVLHFKEEPVPLKAGENSYIYLNLTHIDPDDIPVSAVLTLEAYEPADSHRDEAVVSTLSITLKKPEQVPSAVRLMEPVPGSTDTLGIQSGTHLQNYDPRWWPEEVGYTADSTNLPLTIKREGNQLKVYWQDETTPKILITDRTNPSLLVEGEHQIPYLNTVLFDLFNFDEHHIALRVWFYWLNKGIGGKYFFGRHEVPDSERFDFIMRKESGKVMFVCTDLHWAEMWGEVPEPPLMVDPEGVAHPAPETLRVSLGLTKERIYEELKGKAKGSAGKKFQDVAKWLGIIEDSPPEKYEMNQKHNPIDFIRARTMALYNIDELKKVRDKGSEAHVPQIENAFEYHRSRFNKRNRMISNDVRLVF